MKLFLFALALTSTFSFAHSQAFSESLKAEVAFDGYFSVGNQGGNFALGAKFGLLQKEGDGKLVVGPSVRWMRVWSKNIVSGGNPVNYNVFGGGAFLHYRVVDGLYFGAEFEALRSPQLNGSIITQGKQMIPVLFLGGGYSKAFDDRFRVNIGIFYDVINNLNSPYRRSYLTSKKVGPNGEQGALIPILYRLELVIPLY